jgi:hypothetical protein
MTNITSPWTISAAAERVEPDAQGRAEATFTVTNNGPVDQRTVFDVVAGETANRAWFTVVEPQVLVPHGGSAPFLVRLAVPAGTPAGPRWFAGRAYSADRAPEETSVVSDRVAVEIKPTVAPVPWWRKWWWVFVVAALALITLVVVLFLVLGGDDTGAPPTTTPQPTPSVRGSLTFTVLAANPIDFDEIVSRPSAPGDDIRFVSFAPDAPRSIQPVNGATIGKIGPTDRPGERCAQAGLGNGQLGIDDWAVGEVLCVRTDEGRLSVAVLQGKFNIAGRGPTLTLAVTTFEGR